MSSRRSLTTLLALALAAPSLADVLVVDAAGGGDFPDLASAVAAAQDGDTLLLKPGLYAPPAVLDKGLVIVSEVAEDAVVEGYFLIDGLAAGRSVLLSGLELRGVTDLGGWPLPTLHLTNNAGTVRVDESRVLGVKGSLEAPGGEGIFVVDSADVAVIRSVVKGGRGGPASYDYYSAGAAGMRVEGSVVALYRSMVYGGNGRYGHGENPGGWGGAGLELHDGSLAYAIYDYFEGGDGGGSDDYIAPVCAPGSPGVSLDAGCELVDQASVFVGGEGGFSPLFNHTCDDGLPIAGPGKVTPMAGTPRGLLAPRVAREGQTFELEAYAKPGEQVFLVWSTGTALEPAPPLEGVWLVPRYAPRSFTSHGTVGGGGLLKVPFTLGELGPGVEGRLYYAQLVVRDAAGSPRVGSPVSVQLLDAGL